MITAPSPSISSNSTTSKVNEINDPFLDFSQNIFTGLSFPEVPKNNIIIKPTKPKVEEVNNNAMIELKSTKNEPKLQTIDTTIQKMPTITTNSQAILTPSQFALLYKNDVNNCPSVYPSLTEIVPDVRYFPELATQHIQEDEEELNEQEPLITPTITPIQQNQNNVHDEVMEQLFNENLRLQQQLQEFRSNSTSSQTNEIQDLEELQRSMNYTSSSSTTSTTMTTSSHPLIQSTPYHQPTINQQQQQQQQLTATNSPSTLTQQQQQQTLKYVCCGNCKQWLSAPRNATYVYCPGCEAVNNCTLTPQNSTNTTNRPPVRKLDPQPWYLQCFSRILG